jgi:hypothetical protein
MELLEGLHESIRTQGLVKFDHIIFCPVSSHTDMSSKKGMLSPFPYPATC